MSNGIALVNYLCPICGKIVDSEILIGGVVSDNEDIDKKDIKKSIDIVDSLDKKAVGWANKCCDKCAKDGVVYFIGIDSEKSKPNNPYRTGQIIGIKRDAPFVKQFKEYIITLEDNTKLVFIDQQAGLELGLWEKIKS